MAVIAQASERQQFLSKNIPLNITNYLSASRNKLGENENDSYRSTLVRIFEELQSNQAEIVKQFEANREILKQMESNQQLIKSQFESYANQIEKQIRDFKRIRLVKIDANAKEF